MRDVGARLQADQNAGAIRAKVRALIHTESAANASERLRDKTNLNRDGVGAQAIAVDNGCRRCLTTATKHGISNLPC